MFKFSGEKRDWILFYREAQPHGEMLEKEYLQIKSVNYNSALDELIKHNLKTSKILELRQKEHMNEVRIR